MKNVCLVRQASKILTTVNISLEQLDLILDMQLTPCSLLCKPLLQLVRQHWKCNSTFLSNTEKDLEKIIWYINPLAPEFSFKL
jgi:hypothetical protein